MINKWLLLVGVVVATQIMALTPGPIRVPERNSASSVGRTGQWIAGGGLGLTISPTALLLTPQLEYKHNEHLYYGPSIQMGLSDGWSLFTFSGTIRYVLKSQSKLRPCLEGGLGMAVGDGFTHSIGVHISLGMGFDYMVDPGLTLGTIVRANFAPPMDNFFMTWPILMARFAF